MKFSDILAYCQNNWAFAVLALFMSPLLIGMYLLHLMASLVAPIAEVYVNNEKQKYKIIQFLKKFGIGTKNLPDAIKCHCASYWDLMISKDQIQNIKYSLNLLKKHIAIPIFFSKSKKFYKDLAYVLAKIS